MLSLKLAMAIALSPGVMSLGCRGEPVGEAQLPCAVSSVLERNCQTCHSDPTRGGAPMPLVTEADLHAPSLVDPTQRVYERVRARIHDTAAPMPPPPNMALSAADLATLDAWIAGGAVAAPAGTACGKPGGGGTQSFTPQCDPALTVSLKPAAPIDIPAAPDTLLCYGVALPFGEKRHVIAISPHVGDAALVHHLTLFAADHPVGSQPVPCGPNGEAGWRLVTVWTPGAASIQLPPEAGFPVEGTASYVVQVHYENIAAKKGHRDTSGFDLCTSRELRPNDADVVVFGTDHFDIPARGALDITCDYTVPAELDGVTFVDALPHMHRLGKEISTRLVRPLGGADLGTRSPWTYASQYWSPVEAVARAGDQVKTRCAWANPGDADVKFGETVSDEMCSSFTIYYPRVVTPGWSFTEPTTQSQCHPSP